MTEATPGRGQDGRFTRSIEIAENDAKAARMRARGMSLRQIAAELKYADPASAWKAIHRALVAVPVEAVTELRKLEVEKLDALERISWAVLAKRHHLAQNGRLVIDPETGEPMIDPAPTLAAVDHLLKIQERRARLLGLDAPTKIEARNVSDLDAEIEDLLSRVAERRAIEPGDSGE